MSAQGITLVPRIAAQAGGTGESEESERQLSDSTADEESANRADTFG